jgi:cardiolipin synthase
MKIRIFWRGKEFYRSLEREIARAKKEILISVYSFQNDAIGKRLAKVLKRKLDEGVAVKVILDGIGSRHAGKGIVRMFAGDNHVVRVFRAQKNYLWRHPVICLRRDHARIFLIDRKLLGVGGMCIGRIYEERQDLTVLVPIANPHPVVSYFNHLWALAGKESCGHAASRHFDRPLSAISAVRALMSTPIKEEQMIYRWVIKYAQSAKKCIVIVSAWFLPTGELIQVLRDAKERGVEITIVTPSHTDKRWYDDFRGAAMPKLLEKNIAWYGTRHYFHQKYFFIDDQWCLGSANFDMMSMNRNYELDLCGRGGAIFRELQANFRELVRVSRPIQLTKVNWFIRLFGKILYPVFEVFIVTRRWY